MTVSRPKENTIGKEIEIEQKIMKNFPKAKKAKKDKVVLNLNSPATTWPSESLRLFSPSQSGRTFVLVVVVLVDEKIPP